MITLPIKAQDAKIDGLFAELLAIPADQAEQSLRIVEQISAIWAQSGSASMDLLLKRGSDALEDGDIQAAIDHFSALVDHAPDFAEGYHARAQAYFAAGYYGPALADLRVVLGLNPRHFEAMAGVAILQEEIGNTQEALEILRRVLELNPNDEDALKAVSHLQGIAL